MNGFPVPAKAIDLRACSRGDHFWIGIGWSHLTEQQKCRHCSARRTLTFGVASPSTKETDKNGRT